MFKNSPREECGQKLKIDAKRKHFRLMIWLDKKMPIVRNKIVSATSDDQMRTVKRRDISAMRVERLTWVIKAVYDDTDM